MAYFAPPFALTAPDTCVIGVVMEWQRVVQCDQCGESSIVHAVHFEYTKGDAGYQFNRVVVSANCPICGVRNVAVPVPIHMASIDQPAD